MRERDKIGAGVDYVAEDNVRRLMPAVADRGKREQIIAVAVKGSVDMR